MLRGGASLRSDRRHQFAGDVGVQLHLAQVGGAHRLDQFVRRNVLEQVAVRAGADRREQLVFLAEAGEDDDARMGAAFENAGVASMPSISGMTKSSRTTSGCRCGARSTASTPLAASPTTSMGRRTGHPAVPGRCAAPGAPRHDRPRSAPGWHAVLCSSVSLLSALRSVCTIRGSLLHIDRDRFTDVCTTFCKKRQARRSRRNTKTPRRAQPRGVWLLIERIAGVMLLTRLLYHAGRHRELRRVLQMLLHRALLGRADHRVLVFLREIRGQLDVQGNLAHQCVCGSISMRCTRRMPAVGRPRWRQKPST